MAVKTFSGRWGAMESFLEDINDSFIRNASDITVDAMTAFNWSYELTWGLI